MSHLPTQSSLMVAVGAGPGTGHPTGMMRAALLPAGATLPTPAPLLLPTPITDALFPAGPPPPSSLAPSAEVTRVVSAHASRTGVLGFLPSVACLVQEFDAQPCF